MSAYGLADEERASVRGGENSLLSAAPHYEPLPGAATAMAESHTFGVTP